MEAILYRDHVLDKIDTEIVTIIYKKIRGVFFDEVINDWCDRSLNDNYFVL